MTRNGPGFPRATISTTTHPDSPTNTIRTLTFGQIRNAVVRVGGVGEAQSGQRMGVPPNQVSLAVTVIRENSFQSAIVPVTIEDACGSWPTFIGIGRSSN